MADLPSSSGHTVCGGLVRRRREGDRKEGCDTITRLPRSWGRHIKRVSQPALTRGPSSRRLPIGT